MRRSDDAGTAVVEFSFLAVLLLLPLAYVMLAVFKVQDASYATSSAARAAGRAFVVADTRSEAYRRAGLAATIAMNDHHLDVESNGLLIECAAAPCLTPGAAVDVTVTAHVSLPFVPEFLGGAASVTVHGRDVAMVDRYR